MSNITRVKAVRRREDSEVDEAVKQIDLSGSMDGVDEKKSRMILWLLVWISSK